MTEQEIIKMGVDEYIEQKKNRQRKEEIDAEIKRLQAERDAIPNYFSETPKWQMYLGDKIEAEIKSIESNDLNQVERISQKGKGRNSGSLYSKARLWPRAYDAG